jgi:hypothetical protein
MLPFRADLPEAVVGITPVRRDELHELALHRPRPLGIDAGATRGAEEVHHLAVLSSWNWRAASLPMRTDRDPS